VFDRACSSRQLSASTSGRVPRSVFQAQQQIQVCGRPKSASSTAVCCTLLSQGDARIGVRVVLATHLSRKQNQDRSGVPKGCHGAARGGSAKPSRPGAWAGIDADFTPSTRRPSRSGRRGGALGLWPRRRRSAVAAGQLQKQTIPGACHRPGKAGLGIAPPTGPRPARVAALRAPDFHINEPPAADPSHLEVIPWSASVPRWMVQRFSADLLGVAMFAGEDESMVCYWRRLGAEICSCAGVTPKARRRTRGFQYSCMSTADSGSRPCRCSRWRSLQRREGLGRSVACKITAPRGGCCLQVRGRSTSFYSGPTDASTPAAAVDDRPARLQAAESAAIAPFRRRPNLGRMPRIRQALRFSLFSALRATPTSAGGITRPVRPGFSQGCHQVGSWSPEPGVIRHPRPSGPLL